MTVPRSGFRVALATVGLWLQVLSSDQLVAQADRWDQQVNQGLEKSAQTLQARGYRPLGTPRSGVLLVDQSERIELPFPNQEEYVVVGMCDNDCTGLELVIANETGYEIDAARGGNSPIVRIGPPMRPGNYRLTVTMSGCKVSPCRYGVAAYRRSRSD